MGSPQEKFKAPRKLSDITVFYAFEVFIKWLDPSFILASSGMLNGNFGLFVK